MKLLRHLTAIVCILAAPTTNADEKPNAKATTPSYDTAERIKAMPRCKVTVENRSPCSICLITMDRKRIYLGSPGSTKEVSAFMTTVKDGHTYTLPGDFLAYQKAQK